MSIRFLSFFLSHCVQLPSICIISGKFPGIAYVDILLNFSGLGGKRWGRATCVYKSGNVLTNRLSTFNVQLDVQYGTFRQRGVSTCHHNRGCTNVSALGWRSEPCPCRVCGYIIASVVSTHRLGAEPGDKQIQIFRTQ